MVGLVEDVRRIVQPGFKTEGDAIALLGVTTDELWLSEYSVTVAAMKSEDLIASGKVPSLDLDRERAVQTACLQAAEAGLLKSAHDCLMAVWRWLLRSRAFLHRDASQSEPRSI
jgi:phosphoribosylformylglycinamidine synthase